VRLLFKLCILIGFWFIPITPQGYWVNREFKGLFRKSNELLEITLNSLKQSEGFKSEAYLISNKWTIGYGHSIKKGEKFNKINKEEATNLLEKDFYQIMYIIEEKIDLPDNKLFALTHFAYNIGVYRFFNSTLFKLIEKEKDIDKELLKWSRMNGKIKNNLLKSRYFELDMYNGKFKNKWEKI
jgi:GH24 family phage-related lysozyme (muramidase)